jgi:hypothetical protein
MRKSLLWVGALLCGIGMAVTIASAVMSYLGLNASYNLGDPTKFEFVLIPFWQIGLGALVLGVACLLGSRRRKKNASA